MTSNLYHSELGFPTNIELPKGIFNLNYSHHAQTASYDDRYGQMSLPTTLDVNDAQLIEIEVEDNEVVKGVYRTSYNTDLDLIIVMIPQRSFVKTVWFNKTTDTHKTLQAWKYKRP